MPKSKIEAELNKATKVDPDDYKKRQDYLEAILEAVNAFKDSQWDKLTEPSQLWVNAAIKAKKAEKRLPEYPDVGDVKPGDDDEEEEAPKKKKKPADEDEEEEAPKKKKKAVEEDEEEEEAPKKKKKPVDDEEEEEAPKKKKKPVEDEEEEEAPKKKKKPVEDDEEEEEAPKKKKKPVEDEEEEEERPKKKKKPVEDEEEEEERPKKKKKPVEDEEEEEEAPKKKKEASVPQKSSGIKVAIKDAIIADPEISVDSIVKKLGKGGAEVSKVTVSNVRAEFRHTLKLLKERGKLKGIDL